jgi:hypothetical protein
MNHQPDEGLITQIGMASQRDRPRAKGKASGKRRIRTPRKLPMTGEATRSSTRHAGFGDPTNNSATNPYTRISRPTQVGGRYRAITDRM